MSGLSFGEIFVLIIVAIVVVGPRQLPSMMRTAGQWVSRIRRMSTDLRAQSGIDQLMREEGIERSIQEIRSLSNINVLDGLEKMANAPPGPVVPPARSSRPAATSGLTPAAESKPALTAIPVITELPVAPTMPVTITEKASEGKVSREREYPLVGCDSYGALPDDAAPYGAVATSDPMTFGAPTNGSTSGGSDLI